MVFSNIQLPLSFTSSKVPRKPYTLDKTYVHVSIYKNGTKNYGHLQAFPQSVYRTQSGDILPYT